MGSKGYSYREILKHYFRGAVLERIYDPPTPLKGVKNMAKEM
jgi:hypothetical protein